MNNEIRITPWSERELAYGRSLEELPVLLERVLGTPARLVQLCAHEPSERLIMRRQGSWSVMEHIGHLIYLQDLLDERVEDFAARRNSLCRIELTGQAAMLAGHCRRALGDLLEEFRLKRQHFAGRVASLDPGALRHQAEHPCLGITMTPADMVLYVAEHDDHHLALIRNQIKQWPSFGLERAN